MIGVLKKGLKIKTKVNGENKCLKNNKITLDQDKIIQNQIEIKNFMRRRLLLNKNS